MMPQMGQASPMVQANPMMAGINGLAGQNPLIAGQRLLATMQLMAAAGPGANPLLANLLRPPQQPVVETPTIDPDVMELCDHFHIEERHARRLNDIMKGRQDTFESDMLKLWEKLEDARHPPGLLVVKMREMEEGTFVGKQAADKELIALSKKYKLDQEAESKLADILGRHPIEKRREYMLDIEKHLEVSNRPSAMVMMLLKKLGEGQPLGRPGPPAPGSYLDRAQRDSGRGSSGGDRDRRSGGDRDKDRDRRGDRDRRERSRSRRR